MRICPYCKKIVLDDESKFCTNCYASIENVNTNNMNAEKKEEK